MFETGVGRTQNLRVAACLPQAAAHDLSPSSRYFSRDVIQEPIKMNADGFVKIDHSAFLEIDEQALAQFTQRKIVL